MEALYKVRKQQQQKKMQRYLRYVLNDHLAAVLFILIGGLALYYAQWLKTLATPFPLAKIGFIVLFFLLLPIGKLASFFVPADKSFLLPKETKLASYFKVAVLHSLPLPSFVLSLSFLAYLPLLLKGGHFLQSSLLLLLVQVFVLKYLYLVEEVRQAYGKRSGIFPLLSLLILSVAIYVSPLWSLGLSLLYGLDQKLWLKKSRFLQWDQVIAKEEQRLQNLYRFFALFTEVPEYSSKVKRRAYLDRFFHKIPQQQKNTYVYLYCCHFLRTNEYSGLALRLSLVNAFILLLKPSLLWSLGLSSLFLYLTLIQLHPIMKKSDDVLWTQLYPLGKLEKARGLHFIYQIATLLFGVAASVAALCTGKWILIGLFVFILPLEELLLYRLSLKKIE